MRLVLPLAVTAALAAGAPLLLGHDPRTTPRTMIAALELEGTGSLALRYKPLHFNAERWNDARRNERFLTFLNQAVWGELGEAKLDVATTFGSVEVPAGSFSFGVNMTSDEKFSIVFRDKDGDNTAREWKIALDPIDSPRVEWLTFALVPTTDPARFAIEGRCGAYAGRTEFTVPGVEAPHEHGEGEK